MPQAEVVFYCDENGCSFLEWLGDLPRRVEAKARVRLERLALLGHELRRPEADYLRDGMKGHFEKAPECHQYREG